jgi:hypothetical protein
MSRRFLTMNMIDEIEEVEKFNPWHDAQGKFTSGTGGKATFFTVRTKDPSKQHMADMAVARQKDADAKAQAAAKPKVNVDAHGFKDHDDADFHELHSGKKYYEQQQLTPAQKKAAANYMEAHTEPGSLYSHSQNLNHTMATQGVDALKGKYKETYDGMMSAMHNLGYNVNLYRYDHAGFINTLLGGKNYETMTDAELEKALKGKTVKENKMNSTSYNDLKNAPQETKDTFMTRQVKIIYQARADVQAMMPGKGPGGDAGEIVLAPTNGTNNRGGKILSVRRNGNKARSKGASKWDLSHDQIEIVIEI